MQRVYVQVLIFFDTEFTSLHNKPKLISIGLIAENGQKTFYAELADTYQVTDLSEFALNKVIPLLTHESLLLQKELISQLKFWIESFNSEVMLASDNYTWDWPFIIELFSADNWPTNLSKECFRLNMNYMKDADSYFEAVQTSYEAGLRKHHALDDAKANRLGWLSSNGTQSHY